MKLRLSIIGMAAAVLLAGCSKKEEQRPWNNRYEVDPKTGEIVAIPLKSEPPSVKCFLVSKTDTGKRNYCGKACSAVVYAYTYQCEGGGYVTQER